MSLLKDHSQIDLLAQELSHYTGELTTEATILALQERLVREQAKQKRVISMQQDLLRIGRECAALPVLDARSAETILGYNEAGIAV